MLILPLKPEVEAFAREVEALLKSKKIRVSVDDSSETLNKKIRNAELRKVPYVLVLGPREAAGRSVSVRSKTKGDLGVMKLEDFLAKAVQEIEEKIN